MNLALSALLILLLLLPGFSFRLGIAIYSSLRKHRPETTNELQDQLISRNISKSLSKLNFTETIFLFSLVPVLLHLFSITFLKATGTIIKFDLLLNIFAGKHDVLETSLNKAFQNDLKWFLVYILFEIIAGSLLGTIMSWALLGRKWMTRALTANNIWYRLFTGIALPKDKRQRIASVFVEVLTLNMQTTVVYFGSVNNFEVVPDSDNLSFLILERVRRQDVKDDHSHGPITHVPGDAFTIFGKDIINVNVTYMELITDPTDPAKRKLSPIL